MSTAMKEVLGRAIVKIATPLASILLRNGVSYGLFSELAKRAFVEAAEALQVADKRRVTVTNSAVMTGLTRKEVKRINEMQHDSLQRFDDKYNRAVRVISGWINDKEYSDQVGAPIAIPFNGDAPSFSALVKKYSGDMGARAMLNTLKEAGCVLVTQKPSSESSASEGGEQDAERIMLIKHAYVPQQSDETSINILGADTAELIATIEHNLNAISSDDKWYQRKVSNFKLSHEFLDEFKILAYSKSQWLLEDLDRWLTEHETEESAKQQYVSLGIFYHEAPVGVAAMDETKEEH